MILKLKQNDSWRFIDNIQDVVIPTGGSINPTGFFINYVKNGEELTQEVSQGCYILNDNGKTVEKVC